MGSLTSPDIFMRAVVRVYDRLRRWGGSGSDPVGSDWIGLDRIGARGLKAGGWIDVFPGTPFVFSLTRPFGGRCEGCERIPPPLQFILLLTRIEAADEKVRARANPPNVTLLSIDHFPPKDRRGKGEKRRGRQMYLCRPGWVG